MVFSYEQEQLEQTLTSAKNINAALKSFLKHEAQKGDPAVKFVKALKANAQSKSPGALSEFISKNREKYEQHLFLIARYGHNEVIEPLLNKIITDYAERFNGCYSTNGGTQFQYTNEMLFKEIAKEVNKVTESHLTESELECNGFTKNTVFYSLFEPLVIEELKTVFA